MDAAKRNNSNEAKNRPLVSVCLIVRNGEKYIRQCLEAVTSQTYDNLDLMVFDNNSGDKTKGIIENEFPAFRIIKSAKNYYVGGGCNRCFADAKGKYILALCVDVIIDMDFIKNAVSRMESDEKIGALQSKTLIYDFNGQKLTNIIDTTGFQIFRSRRIINRGHGTKNEGQFENPEEIFSYEGACVFFRRETIEDAKIDGQIFDEEMVWYGDDVDLGWRLNLLGWKNFYDPKVIAWHDRSTTKNLASGHLDFIRSRKTLPAEKKQWDYINQRLAMMKNENIHLFFMDLPYFVFRELKLWIYFLFFERSTIAGVGRLIKLTPSMLKKRKKIAEKTRRTNKEIKKWFI